MPAAAQRVVFTPTLDLPATDIVSLKLRRAMPNPSGDSTIITSLYIGRLLGTRQDSLLLEQDADTLAFAARDVMTLLVWHFNEADRRIEPGSEVAAFGGLSARSLDRLVRHRQGASGAHCNEACRSWLKRFQCRSTADRPPLVMLIRVFGILPTNSFSTTTSSALSNFAR